MADKEGLSPFYRLSYNFRKMVWSVFGPAQLGSQNDPLRKLEAERAAKVAEARRNRA